MVFSALSLVMALSSAIEEMASLLRIEQLDLTVTPGSCVRIRCSKYQGDLAQVMDITENGEEVGLKFIPRIDLNPKDDAMLDTKKRKKPGAGPSSFSMPPPQRLFNSEEVVKVSRAVDRVAEPGLRLPKRHLQGWSHREGLPAHSPPARRR